MKKTYDHWIQSILQVEKLLRELGLPIPAGSPFEAAALEWLTTDYTMKGEVEHDTKADYRERWRRKISLGDLCEKIMAAKARPDFGQLTPHLKLLAGTSDLSQLSHTSRDNRANNYIFELWVAAAAMQFMNHVSLDATDGSSGGTNPDLTGAFQGRRWGIACKALNSWAVPDQEIFTASPQSFVALVKDGVRQINACANIDRGIVIVAMKNSFSHNAVWPAETDPSQDFYYGAYRSVEAAAKPVHDEFGAFQQKVIDLYGSRRRLFDDVFSGSKVTAPILLSYPVITGILHEGNPVFTILHNLCAIFDPDRKDAEADMFAQTLFAFLQNRPDAADRASIELA